MSTHFITQYWKTIFVNITTNLIRKVFKCWLKAMSSWWYMQGFQNSNFHVEVQILSLAQILSAFHEVTVSFSRICLWTTHLWITSLSSVVFSGKNGDLWNNKRLVQLTSQSHKHFSMRQPLFFIMQQKCFTCTLHLIIQSIRKLCIQWLRFTRITNLFLLH